MDFKKMISREYAEEDTEMLGKARRYFAQRLSRAGYELTKENEPARKAMIDFVSRIAVQRQAENFKRPPQAPPERGPYIYGPCGSGKTQLAKILSAMEHIATPRLFIREIVSVHGH